MVPQPELSESARRAAVAYIKKFSGRFEEGSSEPPVPIGDPPPMGKDLVRLGKETYLRAECWKCHGKDAKGNGPSVEGMKDDWGAPIAPPDLTRRPLKVGNTPKALHRTIVIGIEGTPMPSYEDSLSEKEVWALVRFLESLVSKREWENMHSSTPEERRGFMILRHHGREIR